MIRYYKNLEFKRNYKSDKIIKREFTYFYGMSDYVFGKFHRVQLPRVLPGLEYNPVRYIMTFIYLNPRLEEGLYLNFYRYCKKVIYGFNIELDEFNYILRDKDKITYTDCYMVMRKIIYNETKFAKKFKLNVYSRTFHVDLRKCLKEDRLKWWHDANQDLLEKSFYEKMDNVGLSYESLAVDNKLKIEKVKRYLNTIGIFIRESEIEFQEKYNVYDSSGNIIGVKPSEKKIIKKQPFKYYIIEKQLKYLLSKSDELFNINDIYSGCTYYSEYYDEYVQVDKKEIENWIKNNKFYVDRIKKHIKIFHDKKHIIIRQNKIMLLLTLLEFKNNKEGHKKEYHRDKKGKVIISNFGEEFGGDYSVGNYKNKYAQKYDIDEELKNL